METSYSNLFVVLMGVGTVFLGLICIIILIIIMSKIIRAMEKNAPAAVPAPKSAVAAAVPAGNITPEVVAAVGAVIAEEMGTDINAIRIRSFKKL